MKIFYKSPLQSLTTWIVIFSSKILCTYCPPFFASKPMQNLPNMQVKVYLSDTLCRKKMYYKNKFSLIIYNEVKFTPISNRNLLNLVVLKGRWLQMVLTDKTWVPDIPLKVLFFYCLPAQWAPASAIAWRSCPTAGSEIRGKCNSYGGVVLQPGLPQHFKYDLRSASGGRKIPGLTLSFAKCTNKSLTRSKLRNK